jgi:hypothetical protein
MAQVSMGTTVIFFNCFDELVKHGDILQISHLLNSSNFSSRLWCGINQRLALLCVF